MTEEKEKKFIRLAGFYRRPWGELQGFTFKSGEQIEAFKELVSKFEIGGRLTVEEVPDEYKRSDKSPDFSLKYETKASVEKREAARQAALAKKQPAPVNGESLLD